MNVGELGPVHPCCGSYPEHRYPVCTPEHRYPVCTAVQPHWGWPCTRGAHPAGTPHINYPDGEVQVRALWWELYEDGELLKSGRLGLPGVVGPGGTRRPLDTVDSTA